ncbi:16S rRNA (adenine(1518)-N(6)/adenine(1519)-N(6)) -dimethyltransferase RsmA [Ignavibacteria bacterium]|nr:ribosomal RNA small subunit methyltransferase A [Bacteroidota bacterium]MCZ2131725.1 16S rRNA (adenine(1518)-N(6)/adenine(1519)-N(6))-dimethyltransferase RsmA [Bacteroidota bacterium]
MIRPKKSLGQNFLRDDNIAAAIVRALECNEGDAIVEIGPGTGALTNLIAKLPVNLTAIELDRRAITELRVLFPSSTFPNVAICEGDFLQFDIQALSASDSRCKIIGNIPYYITADILFRIFENVPAIDRAVIMMQREVAERITAQPRTKEYGILSVAAAFSSRPRKLFNVSPSCFYPKPKVESSVVLFDCSQQLLASERFKPVMSLVRAAFGQRRKVLGNALKAYCNAVRTELPIEYARRRAEELTPTEFVNLYEQMHL